MAPDDGSGPKTLPGSPCPRCSQYELDRTELVSMAKRVTVIEQRIDKIFDSLADIRQSLNHIIARVKPT